MTTKKMLAMLIRSRSFSAALEGKNILLIKILNGRPVSIRLKPFKDDTSNEGFWLEPPSYNFKSSTSHFDYVDDETRLTRNKGVIISLVKDLQQTEAWDYIVNKNFFVPNKNNKALLKDKHLKKKIFFQFDTLLKPGRN